MFFHQILLTHKITNNLRFIWKLSKCLLLNYYISNYLIYFSKKLEILSSKHVEDLDAEIKINSFRLRRYHLRSVFSHPTIYNSLDFPSYPESMSLMMEYLIIHAVLRRFQLFFMIFSCCFSGIFPTFMSHFHIHI